MIRSAITLCLLAGALAAQAQNNPGNPGMTVNAAKPVFQAKLFAEGTISIPGSYAITFTPDGKTAYFSRGSSIMESHFQNGKWSAPVTASFSGQYRDLDPFLSPDGSQMFFSSFRPIEGHQRKAPGLWVVNKTDKGWSEPRDLGASINGPAGGPDSPSVSPEGHLYYPGPGFPSVAANGTLYFCMPGPQGGIYRARRAGEKYGMPERLGPEINSEQNNWDAYVAPDESFIVFTSDRPGGFGMGDLYISTHKNGVWTTPRNLGPSINSTKSEYAPAVSRDGKTFFFTSGGRPEGPGIYQIDVRALGLEQK